MADFTITGPGMDVSHHNVDDRGSAIDWAQVRGAGFEFVFAKATDGSTGSGIFKDPKFVDNVNGARDAGLHVGAYHFLRPGKQAADQAAAFLEMVDAAGGVDALDLGAAVDVEDPDDDPNAWNRITRVQRIAKVSHFLDAVEAVFPDRPFIYCIPSWWAEMFGTAGDFSGHPLWAASPGRNPDLSGTTWTDWAIWQYSFYGTVPGLGFKSVDLDRFSAGFGSEDL